MSCVADRGAPRERELAVSWVVDRAREAVPDPHGVSRAASVAKTRVLVAGGSGYAGAIAARLVDRHPRSSCPPSRAAATRRPLSASIRHHRVDAVLEELDVDVHGGVDAAIVAYPRRGRTVVAALLQRGVRVVDLSADFRLRDRPTYERWYGEHGAPERFGSGVYGLPEVYGEQIAGADLVANPGCYPTATLLALAPLARSGTVADVVVDAKSGVSGAGRARRRSRRTS